MVRYKVEFNPVDLEQYRKKYKQAKIAYPGRKLNELKMEEAYRSLKRIFSCGCIEVWKDL